jgi:hypothetical protein
MQATNHGQSPAQAHWTRLFILLFCTTVLGALCAFLFYRAREEYAFALSMLLLGAMVLLWRPIVGFYALFGAAVVVDQWDGTKFGLPSTWVPLWASLDTITALPLRFSFAEILMLTTLVIVLCTQVSRQDRLRLDTGRLGVHFLALILVLSYGLIRGVGYEDYRQVYGFHLGAAATELRALTYVPLMYMVAYLTIRTPEQVRILIYVLIATLGSKILQLIWTIVGLGSRVFDFNEIANHEDSLLLSLVFPLAAGLWIYRGPFKTRCSAVSLLPLAVVVLIANQRRAGFLSLAIGMAVLIAVLVSDRQVRSRVLRVSLVLLLVSVGYGTAFWNTEGPLAIPVYAFRSIYQPDERDLYSNFFRQVENLNIRHTIEQSPILGIGVGQRYYTWIQPESLDYSGFTYWRYITHNATYWVWMKFGVLGFIVFWYLIGAALILGCQVFRRLQGAELKTATLVAVAFIAMQMVFSYLDMGLTTAKNMVYLGSWLGVLASLDRLAPTPGLAPHSAE